MNINFLRDLKETAWEYKYRKYKIQEKIVKSIKLLSEEKI